MNLYNSVPDINILANSLAILRDIADIIEDVHAYKLINKADLAPKKVCFERAHPLTS